MATRAISAAILAGGHASRFGGRDKSALVVDAGDGRTILERQVDALTPLTDDILIVGGASHPRARTIADRVAGCGPLGGLHAALLEARGDPVILLACDMPFVTTGFLAHLVDRAESAGPAGPEIGVAVVPATERGYHPLCAAYSRAALRVVEQHLAERRLKMTDLLAQLHLVSVASEDVERFDDRHRLLTNVNTAADFASINH